jgi:2-alkenal reductase
LLFERGVVKKKQKRKSTMSSRKVLFWVILGVVIMTALAYLDRASGPGRRIDSKPREIQPRGDLAEFEKATIEIFTASAPSVVYIFTENAVRTFFGAQQVRQGAGSGFFWDRHGHVVTNFHVIQGAQRIQVRMDSGEAIEAAFVGGTPDYDLAVVRLRSIPAGIAPIPLGTSENLQVGQAVFAIGNPFGLSRTLTTGIISAIDRRLPTAAGREIAGVIQTDAAINPGNSGGPLIDSAGRLIGVNTAIISESGTSAGIGFAVPATIVNRVVPQLIAKGHMPRPGIGIIAVDESIAAGLDVTGLVIERVLPNSSAERAGLTGIDYENRLLGDIIVEAAGREVNAIDDFAQILQDLEIGQTISLKVRRGSTVRIVEVEIMDIT